MSFTIILVISFRPGLWHKARKMTLTAGQTDVKVGSCEIDKIDVSFVLNNLCCFLFSFEICNR